VNNTGLDKMKIKSLKIFPNPASSEIHFELPEKSAGNVSLIIYSEDGTLLFHRKSTGVQNAVADISMLPCGSYLVKLIAVNEIYQTKLIIER
jgi:hypothetical protein